MNSHAHPSQPCAKHDPILDVDVIVARHGTQADALIPILQDIQASFHYLPPEALRRVCELTAITPAQLTGVATFYSQFRHTPAGRHLIRVCHGTACHVSGAEQISNALRRHLHLADGEETDADGQFTIERVACLGCCTLAPLMVIDETPQGRLDPVRAVRVLEQFSRAEAEPVPRTAVQPTASRPVDGTRPVLELRIGLNSCCLANGSLNVRDALAREAVRLGADVRIKPVGCTGMCHCVPLVEVVPAEGPVQLYGGNDARTALEIVRRHVRPKGIGPHLRRGLDRVLDLMMPNTGERTAAAIDPLQGPAGAFLGGQVRIVTERCGELDPLDLDDYVSAGGYAALRECVTSLGAEGTIGLVRKAGLRGRGGAGYPTAEKWARARAEAGDDKFVICNGDEGDPGAFMDRMLLEAYPHRIIEGLAIAAFAIGARRGIFYIRNEYRLAVERIEQALVQAKERGFLGRGLFGTNFDLHVEIRRGAGAFVCGEETALIASIEGRRGMPRLRPPYPTEQGLWGRPTVVNNVETLGSLSWIVRHGAQAYAAHGTANSRGTKVFALAGRVARGGLIEVPMGTTLWQIVHGIGGGIQGGGRLKAVQIGGPSGGCVPAWMAETPIDFEALAATGAIMGSGGLIVMDETTCMVEMARYFLDFTQEESCGRCTFCRVGTRRMLEILERICAGRGKRSDLDDLEELANHVRKASLCGLGKTAPNPVLTTLRYFRDEYEAHLEGRCPAGRCAALVRYRITNRCIGCTICAQECPTQAIAATPYAVHRVDDERCVRCGICLQVCPQSAVEIVSGPPEAAGLEAKR